MSDSYAKKSPLFLIIFIAVILWFFGASILEKIGGFLIREDSPSPSDAIVVLFTGTEYYERLAEAADLYRKKLAPEIVINGNRKSDFYRKLESKGFKPACAWYEDALGVLSLLGVPKKDVILISAENVYDTVSEALTVGDRLKEKGYAKLIITTSKTHTRRAGFTWKRQWESQFIIFTVSAKADPYNPAAWWKDGRQIRWTLWEYGSWIYYYWKSFTGKRLS